MKKFCAHIIIGFMRLLALLPLKVHYALCDCLAWLMRDVFRYRRKVVQTNLLHAFPDRSEREREDILKGFYRHFGEIIAEAVWFGGTRSLKRLHRQDICEFTRVDEHARELEGARGVMYLTSHCGNWELFGGWFHYSPKGSLPYREEDVIAVYKRLSSEVWDEVMERNRFWPMGDFGGYVESRDVLRFTFRHPERRTFLFNTDQYPYKGAKGYETQFLHQPTMVMQGGASIACRLGIAVVYACFDRVRRGHYEARFTVLAKDASQTTPEELTDRYYSMLQRDIEAQPSNYLWSHKRWKNLYDYK